MKIINSFSGAETELAGECLGKTIKENTVVALFGELGAGKTAFTAGLVKGLGIDAEVTSPTFAICNQKPANEFSRS